MRKELKNLNQNNMEPIIKGKTLITKDTNEFLVIEYFNNEYHVCTTCRPKVYKETATMEMLIEYYSSKTDEIDFSNMELKNLEIKVC